MNRGAFYRVSSLVIVVALTVVFAVATAVADELPAEDFAQFEEYVRQGSDALEAQAFAEAVERFERARDIIDHPRISFTIAQAYEEWGRCIEARRELKALSHRDDVQVQQELAQHVDRRLDATSQCAQMGRIIISCEPTDASLQTAEKPLGSCPAEVELSAGVHELSARAPGFLIETRSVEVVPLEEKAIHLELVEEPIQVDEASSFGWLKIAGYGATGLGLVLVGGGAIVDRGARERLEQMQAASETDELLRLEQEAESARTRALTLYGTGALLTAGGVVMAVYYHSASTSNGNGESTYYVVPLQDGIGVGGNWRW